MAYTGLPSVQVPLTIIASATGNKTLQLISTGASTAYDITMAGACSFTIAGGVAGQLSTLTLYLRQDSTGGRAATFSNVVWPLGGVAPTLTTTAGRLDVIQLFTLDGSTYLGNVISTNALASALGALPVAGKSAPNPPTIMLTALDGQVSVAWVDGLANGAVITSHKLYRSSTSGAEILVGTIMTGTPYLDSGLSDGTTYYYQLTAVNSAGESSKSLEVSVQPVAGATPVYTTFSTANLVAASTGSFGLSGKQYSNNTGIADLGNVTLGNGSGGDWTFGLVTRMPLPSSTDYVSGFLANIGTNSATVLTDAGSMSLVYSGQYQPAWTNTHYCQNAVHAFLTDDAGVGVSGRRTNDTIYGVSNAEPLVGSFLADGLVHGLFLVCQSGVVTFYNTDALGHAVAIDNSYDTNQAFKGITNKPLRIGGPLMPSIPTTPGTAFWSQPIQGIVIKNGHAATRSEMAAIVQGADARNVLSLNSTNGDRYWPGTISGSSLTELMASQNGTISGTGTSQAANLFSSSYTDSVTLYQDTGPSVLPRAKASASTSPVAVWGSRNGTFATNIQLRIVNAGSASPATGADVIDDWQTVATSVGDLMAWKGVFNSTAAHAAPLGSYDWEERHTKSDGTYTTVVRENKKFSLGIVIAQAGQSILQKFFDDSGAQVTIPTASANAVRYYQNVSNASYFQGVVGQNYLQGWQSCSGYSNYGASTLVSRLTTLTNGAVGFSNGAVGGQSINAYVPTTGPAWQRFATTLTRTRPQYIVWGNGQADATMSQATRFAALDSFLQQVDAVVAAAPGGVWPYTFLIFPINGDFGSTAADPNSIRAIDMAWTASRNTTRPSAVANCSSVQILTYILDEQTQDGTHPSDNAHGFGMLGERYAQTIAFLAGATTGPGYGPSWDFTNSSYTTSGGSTTLTMAFLPRSDVSSLATANGGAITGGTVSLDGGNTFAAATGAIVSATQVTFTITGTPSSTVQFLYQKGRPGTTTGSGGASPTDTAKGVVGALYDTRGQTISLNEAGNLLPGFPVPPVPLPMTVPLAGASTGTTTTGTMSATPTITMGQPSNSATAGSAYSIPFTLANYSSTPTLSSSLDGGSYIAVPAGYTSTAGSLVVPVASSTAGTHTARIMDSVGDVSNIVTYTVVAAPASTLNYAKQTIVSGSGDSTPTPNYTFTLPTAPASTSNLLFLAGTFNVDPTMPTGWTKITDNINSGAVSAWWAPATAITGNSLTVVFPSGYGGAYLIEDTVSKSYGGSAGGAASSGANVLANLPGAATGKAFAQRYALIWAYRATLATVTVNSPAILVDQTPGGDGKGNGFTALATFTGSIGTGPITFVDGGVSVNSGALYVAVNGYTS